MKTPAKTLALLAAVSTLGSVSASAATLNIGVTGDSYIRASTTTSNNGSQYLQVGDIGTNNDVIRSVLLFSLDTTTHPELAGAQINSVTFRISVLAKDANVNAYNHDETLQLFRLIPTFDETTVTWNNLGADIFNPAAPLASFVANPTTVALRDTFSFSSEDLKTSVVGSIGSTYGLLIKLSGENDGYRSIFNLSAGSTTNASREKDPAYLPTLVIDYTPASAIPEPSSFAALAGLGMLGFAAGRRRARR